MEEQIKALKLMLNKKDEIIEFLQVNCLNEENLSDDLLKYYKELLSDESKL